MKFDELNEKNILLFAIKNYENPNATTLEDFRTDMRRFKYIKRLFKKYIADNELKYHLILNHIIILYNVFGDAATPLMFYKIDRQYWSILKAFLVFLNRFPEYPNSTTTLNSIQEDLRCLTILNSI